MPLDMRKPTCNRRVSQHSTTWSLSKVWSSAFSYPFLFKHAETDILKCFLLFLLSRNVPLQVDTAVIGRLCIGQSIPEVIKEKGKGKTRRLTNRCQHPEHFRNQLQKKPNTTPMRQQILGGISQG